MSKAKDYGDLKKCADQIYKLDLHMQKISQQIEQYNMNKK